MASRGYDVVVDVDAEGDLGHTDLQEDNLEFHSSDFSTTGANRGSKFFPDGNGNNGSAGGFSTGGSGGGIGGAPGSSKRYLWSLNFYAQFFDVDTSEVIRRCRSSLFPRTSFLDILDGNPDLYGPFWIATTVVFILFLTGTISQYLAEAHDIHFEYNFTLLSGAAGLIYGYTGIVPIALWAALMWFGSAGGGSSASIVEMWALFGYANSIWIPVALISWSPITILNYVFVAVGFAWSLAFLLRNLWPITSVTERKISKLLLIAVIVLHAGLAIAIKILFFAHGSPANKTTPGGAPGTAPGAPATGTGAPVVGKPGDAAPTAAPAPPGVAPTAPAAAPPAAAHLLMRAFMGF